MVCRAAKALASTVALLPEHRIPYIPPVTSDPNSPNRFNEDSATYAVRGSETPDLDAGVAAIRNVLATLPVRPGVYRMQDARGDVLYVGKARALTLVGLHTHPHWIGRDVADLHQIAELTAVSGFFARHVVCSSFCHP
ncbi:MAG: hypothetical protein ACK4GG_13535, partial [Sphingomonas sp.]